LSTNIIFAFCTALVIAILAIPSIIRVSYLKHLYDVPDDRKSHNKSIPTLGGLAIFAGFFISMLLFLPEDLPVKNVQFLLVAILIIFFIGLKDDILITAPLKKLLGQILAVSILVFLGDLQLTSLYGLFEIYEIPEWIGKPLTVFTLLVIMNGFNLIDGINWLSGGVGFLVCSTFGVWFWVNNLDSLAIISFSLSGSLIGFLWYNKTPAQIFMGDTGSLILGMINGFLCINFIENNNTAPNYAFNSIAILAFGILIVPLYDTLRVFAKRILAGKSPFYPDRNHIHHRLLEIGFSHIKSSITIIFFNFLIIVISFFLRNIGSLELLLVQLFMASILSYIPSYIIRKRNKKNQLEDLNNNHTSNNVEDLLL
jgi:UDP-GlcNAc:undecaprenyl-phosphate GlcNAc-1-phosphate transferase